MSLSHSNTAFQTDVVTFAPATASVASISTLARRVRVEPRRSVWSDSLQKRFDQLASLPKGWDGYQGSPVSFTCAQFAANLLERLCVADVPPPQLVPGSDGTLQIEWHRNQFDVEIDILAPFEVVAVRRNLTTEVVEELELQMDFSPLTDWIAELRDKQPVADKKKA